MPRPRAESGEAFSQHFPDDKKCVCKENEKLFAPTTTTTSMEKNFCIFSSVEAIFYAAANMPNESYPFLPHLGLPNKLMPFLFIFYKYPRLLLRQRQRLECWCCHPIFQVTQVLERKKLYILLSKQRRIFYNFLFNANK